MSDALPVRKNLAIHAILKQSEVNGPGLREVIWTQGCTKACPGCFNPETWAPGKAEGNPLVLADFLFSSRPDGLTLTGGDPLEQPEALLDFLEELHRGEPPETLSADFLPRGIICFTGYLLEELEGDALECVKYIDLLIDGRYIEKLRYTSGLAGSKNQRFHFNQLPGRGEARIKREEVLIDQAVEIHIDEDDASVVRITGFPSINRRFLKKYGLTIENENSGSKDKVE